MTKLLPFHSHASVLLVVSAVGGFYWWAFSSLSQRLTLENAHHTDVKIAATQLNEAPGEVTRRHRVWIAIALGIIVVFASWPVHDIAERYLFSVHMGQHLVFTMILPPCFLLGTPRWLWNWFLDFPVLRRILQVGSRPIFAFIVANSVTAVTHWRGIVESSLHNEWVHFGVHCLLFSTWTLVWIPIINRTDRLPNPSAPLKMMLLFATSLVPTAMSALLVFATHSSYPTYASAPRLIAGLDALSDQQIAASIMKVWTGMYMWGVIVYLFTKWSRDDKMTVVDAPLNIAGLTVAGKRVV